MNRVRFTTTSVSLAILVMACGSTQTPDGTTQSGSGGSSSANVGGNSSGPAGGDKAGPTSSGSQTGPKGGSSAAGSSKNATQGPEGGSDEGGAANESSGSTATGGKGNTGAGGGTAAGGKGNTGAGGGTAAGGKSGNGGAGGTQADTSDGKGGDSTTGGAATNTTPVVTEVKVITSSNNAFWKDATFTEGTGNATVTVSDSGSQNWDGFGGTFNEKGWAALQKLSEADREKALKLLFDPVEGANFVLGRIPIGASDYAMDRYTLNENKGDYEMAKFSVDRDKEKLIPYIQAAQKVRSDIFFWGSPWTPPTWMKDNGAFDRGNMKSDAQTLGAYALYLAKFVQEYEKEGITVKAVHPQNEPGYPQDYPSCLWSGATMASFIGKYMGPKFKELNLGAQIWCGTMSNNQTDSGILNTVLSNSDAKGYIKGVGLQWTMYDATVNAGGLPVWQTEHKCGNYPWEGGNANKAPNDWAYGVESWGLIRDWIKNKKVNAYSAWNMVLDPVGRNLDEVRPWAQNALLVVDGTKLIQTPAYYVFRHLSQYVNPGAKVVNASGGDALGFKNADGSVVAILYSSGGGNQVVAAGGKKISFSMSGGGWATVVVPKP